MGCLFSRCKKKYKDKINIPLNKTNDHTKDIMFPNNNISILVNETKSTEYNHNNQNNQNNQNIQNNQNNESKDNKENKDILISENESKTNDDSNTIYSEKGLNLNENIGDDEPLLREDSPLICDYEKGVLTFTKNGFLKLFEELWALDNYKSVYDKDDLLIEVRYEGTPMNYKFYLIRMVYKINKSDLKYNNDVDSIMDYCYDLKLRLMWDDSLKLYEKYEGNDNSFIICSWGKSPVFFVSERETIEKRFRFKKGNSTYVMSTSIPLDLYEPKEGVVRFIDFLNLFKVTDEGDYILFTSLNQVDFKMSIPQMLINMTLPSTSKTWYNNIKKFCNSIIWDREKKTYEMKKDENDE